jgi:phosphomannomutase
MGTISKLDKRRLPSQLLREYDIRGTFGDDLTADVAFAIGAGFATLVRRTGGERVCVGYDGRLSSPELEAAVTAGVLATGLDVIRVGRGPTPMLYFAVRHFHADGGLMVTGSHNPPDQNGFKMMYAKAPLYGDDIREIGAISAAGDFPPSDRQSSAIDRAVGTFTAYVDALRTGFSGGRPLTAVWDLGNGAAGEVVAALTSRLPGTHILINEAIDGTFPAHHPDPTVPANLVQLQEAVLAHRADLGFAFDGDGDRLGVIDGRGRILWGDQFLILLAADVLGRNPGATVIADVKASDVLFDEIARLGGRPLMWRTGHSLIKAKMAETGALLAGEMSGHIFVADRWYGFDDAVYAAVRLLEILSCSDQSLADWHDTLPQRVNTPELRIPCPADRKFAIVAEVKERLLKESAIVDTVDGVRVREVDGWWLLRASNTQDLLVARAEAGDARGLARLVAAMSRQLSASSVVLPHELRPALPDDEGHAPAGALALEASR